MELQAENFAQQQQQTPEDNSASEHYFLPSTAAHISLYDAINSSRFWQHPAPPYQQPTFAPYPSPSSSTSPANSSTTDSASTYTPFAPAALRRLAVDQVLPSIPPTANLLPNPGAYLPTTPPPERPLAPAPKLKNFIAKLWHLVSHPESYRDCICWSDSGACIILCHSNPRFAKTVLPSLFQHSNLHSFTRQLNVYTFRRLPATKLAQHVVLKPGDKSEFSAWTHPEFRRGEKARLVGLVPRESKSRRMKKERGVSSGSSEA